MSNMIKRLIGKSKKKDNNEVSNNGKKSNQKSNSKNNGQEIECNPKYYQSIITLFDIDISEA